MVKLLECWSCSETIAIERSVKRRSRFDKIYTTLRPPLSAAVPPPTDRHTLQHMDRSPIGLPNEIIEEILSKSDFKSLVRSKSVSKSWQSVISRILESKLSENQNKFFFWTMPGKNDPLYLMRFEKNGKFRSEPASGYPLGKPLTFPVCSCNGLLLLRNYVSVMLWNPIIGKRITIPTFYAKGHPQNHYFYHDSTTDDHKIVFVHGACYVVYSCKNEGWGEEKTLPYEFIDETNMVAFVDGCFYRLQDADDEITCYDARDGKLQKLEVPNEARGRNELALEEVSGRLCLLFWDEDGKLLHLWVMEESRSLERRWRKVLGMGKEIPNVWDLCPVCLNNEDDVILLGKVLEGERTVTKHFIYNPRQNNNIRKIQLDWEYPGGCFSYSASLYMPSLNMCV